MTKGTGRYADDPRVDKIVTWAFSIVFVVLLGVAGFFCRSLLASVEGLKDTVAELTLKVAVLQVSQSAIADHETRIRALEAK